MAVSSVELLREHHSNVTLISNPDWLKAIEALQKEEVDLGS